MKHRINQALSNLQAMRFLNYNLEPCGGRNDGLDGLSNNSIAVGLGADAELDALVKRHVPRAEVTSRSAGEAAFRLPKEDSSRCATYSSALL